MLPIPTNILTQYEVVLKKRAIPVSRYPDYRKWLRYYLYFRSKYPPPDSKSEQVRLFIEKLQKKNQSSEQQKQAAHALSLFFESEQWKKHASLTLNKEKPSLLPSLLPQREFNKTLTPISLSTSPFTGEKINFPKLSSGGKRLSGWKCLKKNRISSLGQDHRQSC